MHTWYTEDIFKNDAPQIDKVSVYPVIFKTALLSKALQSAIQMLYIIIIIIIIIIITIHPNLLSLNILFKLPI